LAEFVKQIELTVLKPGLKKGEFMFRSALTELAALSVSGVNANYDIDAVPEHLNRGQLPVLIVLPLETDAAQDRRLFVNRGRGFEAVAFSEGARTVTYRVTHLLIVAPVSAGHGLRSHLPQLVDLIDNYFSALSAAVTLDGRLLEPARVEVEPGVFTLSGAQFYGCAFRHIWVVQV
jgi:hypothetical protein